MGGMGANVWCFRVVKFMGWVMGWLASSYVWWVRDRLS